MGWRPYDYYNSSPYEFKCACEGYFNKLETYIRIHRIGAHYSYLNAGGTEKNLDRFWPVKGYKSVPAKKMRIDEEMWEKIKKSHNIV